MVEVERHLKYEKSCTEHFKPKDCMLLFINIFLPQALVYEFPFQVKPRWMWVIPSFSLWLWLTPWCLMVWELLCRLLWHHHKSKSDFISLSCFFTAQRGAWERLCFVFLSRQCVPCTLDEVLGPPTTPEARNDEKALLEQLVNFLSGTDESELAELDKALGIDKLIQVSRS